MVIRHTLRLDRPVRPYARCLEEIPRQFRQSILHEQESGAASVSSDPWCLATLSYHRSLMPLAQEARKPMFFLTPADGAIGGHSATVQESYREFRSLARAIAGRLGIVLG